MLTLIYLQTAYVSETNAVLTKPPIMSTLEVPSKADALSSSTMSEEGVSTNLDDSLAVIGVKRETKSIPASLELPITITNPKIVAKTTQASIKSVYMTTTAVCGSKFEIGVDREWSKDIITEEVESNGHEQIVMMGEGNNTEQSVDGQDGEETVVVVSDGVVGEKETTIVVADGGEGEVLTT